MQEFAKEDVVTEPTRVFRWILVELNSIIFNFVLVIV